LEAVKLVFPGGLSFEKNNELAYCWLRKSAEAGKPEAQANLGWLLLKGVGCNRDTAEARKWFMAAVDHEISQAALGLAEFFGDVGAANFDQVEQRRWLTQAADWGNTSASFQLGVAICGSEESANDFPDAERYLSFAADRNHVEASFQLGSLLLRRTLNDVEVERAANRLRSAAKAGHIGAAYLLGDLFSRGDKIRPDIREAAKWFRVAADAGHVQAQFQTGCFFARGEGVPKDLVHAARYFELSARGGHFIGALNIAIFLEKGEGVERDLNRALAWLRIASEGGIPQAHVRLAHLLSSGDLGMRDISTATGLFEQAAKVGNTEAEVALAQILMSRPDAESVGRAYTLLESAVNKGHMGAADLILAGSSVQDRFRPAALAAVRLVESAVKTGSARAMVLLSRELHRGRYIRSDLKMAEDLLTQAAATGDPAANFELGVHFCSRQKDAADLANGLQFYIRAADLGHVIAQYNAGVMLLRGTGADSNVPQATKYLMSAAAKGMEEAKAVLGELGKDRVSLGIGS